MSKRGQLYKALLNQVLEEQTIEGPFIGDIIYQQNAHSTSVICRRDCPKSLLPRSIPYL